MALLKLIGCGPRSVTFNGDLGMVCLSGSNGKVSLTYVLGTIKGSEEVVFLEPNEIFQIKQVEAKKIKVGENKILKISFVVDTTLYVVNIQN